MHKKRRVLDGQRGLIMAVFVASLCLNLLVLTTPLYMLQLFSRVMSSGSIPTLLALTGVAVGALIFYMLFDMVRQRLISRLGNRLESNLGPFLLKAVVRGEGGVSDTQPIRDLQDLRAFLISPGFTALLDAPWSLLFLLMIYLFHPLLGVVATVGLGVLFLFAIIGEFTGRVPARQAESTLRKTNAAADEILRNADIVRAMGRTDTMVQRWRGKSFASILFGTEASDRLALMTSSAKMVRMLLQIAIMGVGVILVLKGQMGPGMMIAASILLGRAAAPVEQSIAGWRNFLKARDARKNLNELLGQIEEEKDLMQLPEPEGHLSVEGATIVLPGHQDPLVMDVNFELRPGDRLGLIGPSGAGKTTLARALVGLQPLTRGYVRIDDAALTDWPAEQIGQHIGFLPQQVELFEGTIAENIALMDPDAEPSKVVEAAKRAHAHELILGFPGGYNYQVGPRGDWLSAGQRQRIGLARAFFGDPRLIVLDEPNSNLDPVGEEALARGIEAAAADGAVVVVVTHRKSLLRAVSHAGVMENGRLVRFGKANVVVDAEVTPMAGQVSAEYDDPNIYMFRPAPRVKTVEGGAK